MRKIALFLISLMMISITQTVLVIAIPGQTTITSNKNSYTQYEMVTVTLKANSMDLPIGHFLAWTCYDSEGSADYAYPETILSAHLISGTLYEATFDFQVAKGNKYVYIQAKAIDTQSSAGPGATAIVYVTQQVSPGGNESNSDNTLNQQNNQQSDNSSLFIIGFLIVIILLIIIIVMITVKKKK